MRVALLQINATVGAIDANADSILAAAGRARDLGADVAVTSELALTGYPPRDLLERPAFLSRVLAKNVELVGRIPEGLALFFGTVDEKGGAEGRPLYNAVFAARRGEVLARAHKVLLPTYDVFDEDRYFEPGEDVTVVRVGDALIGITICEDAWNDMVQVAHRAYVGPSDENVGARVPRYHENPVCQLVHRGVDLIVNLSASPFTLPKREARAEMFAQIARTHRVPVAFVNQVGGNDELVFDGRSAVFSKTGEVIARAHAFAEDLVVCDLETRAAVAPDLASDEEAAYQALTLGTRDYATK